MATSSYPSYGHHVRALVTYVNTVTNITIDRGVRVWLCADMPKAVVRIPLDVAPELADAIDRAVNLLGLESGQRQTRSSFLKRAAQAEIDRLEEKYSDAMKR